MATNPPAIIPTAPALPPDIATQIAAVLGQMKALQNAPSLGVHGPYEDLGIKALEVIEKVIDGMSADQKAKVWGDWIAFWSPTIQAAIAANNAIMKPIIDGLKGAQ